MLNEIVQKVEARLSQKQSCTRCDACGSDAQLQGSIEVALFLTGLMKEQLNSAPDYNSLISDAIIVSSEALFIALVAHRRNDEKIRQRRYLEREDGASPVRSVYRVSDDRGG